ncbi:MAG: LysR family transcriptional regulator [Oscillospiraceae bacterium]|nr:LysR family transcriptional regulator [Oscillospiraceae bacterium]
MTVLQLQYILEVNRTRFITKAARNLFVAPSSVSTAIAALEAELGYPIFVRDRKGVQPTQQGLWVLTHASSICEHHRLILRGAAASQTFCVDTSKYAVFACAFDRLARECREAAMLTHREALQKVAMDRLMLLDTDLVVLTVLPSTMITFENDMKSRNLKWQIPKTVPAVVRIGPGHRLYHKPELSPEDVAKQTLVGTEDGTAFHSSTLRTAIDMNPERVIRVADRHLRYERIARGAAMAWVPKCQSSWTRSMGFDPSLCTICTTILFPPQIRCAS